MTVASRCCTVTGADAVPETVWVTDPLATVGGVVEPLAPTDSIYICRSIAAQPVCESEMTAEINVRILSALRARQLERQHLTA